MDTLPKLSPAQTLLLHTTARRADERVIAPDTRRKPPATPRPHWVSLTSRFHVAGVRTANSANLVS